MQLESGRAVILYDDALVDHADPALFVPPVEAAAAVGGRGSAWLVQHGADQWVLRHYRRGGLPGRFIHDAYLWTGLEVTRAWREWRLLYSLYQEGLPVPQPVAAQVVRTGFIYRADLITRRILAASSIATLMEGGGESRIPWSEAGRTVRRLHDAGVFHADLNAHNLLVDAAAKVHVIDLDRGERRGPGAWRQANLARLERSLCKLTGSKAVIAPAWAAFLDGYRA
ncbi:MAG TPA: 3-deoxy-D-manno-octulosonic acid kinase [Gammaproteobacteria bacterium]|nr:3-deoxy-D-manno-octulosonic acid kinase [Gammaproteobacteria bacterium]